MSLFNHYDKKNKEHIEPLIKQLSNSQLIFEWLLIRTVNQNTAAIKEVACYLLTIFEDRNLLMVLEEVTTHELISRGLFRLALNQCYKLQTGEISLKQLKLSCHLSKPSNLKQFYH